MKAACFFLPLVWLWPLVSWSQPCSQITINNVKQRQLLTEYIDECIRERYFCGDKGVIVVTRFKDDKGRQSWLLRAELDDHYKENPPKEWALLEEDIVLFYDAKSRYEVHKTKPTPELLQCLDDGIGDRLYVRPPKRQRWAEIINVDGKTRQAKINGRVTGGNTHNDKIIYFESNGTITILKSV